MQIDVNITNKTFTVTKGAEEKKDQHGRQKADKDTNELLWTVQVMALDVTGGEVINVTLAGNAQPKVAVGSVVVPVELVAMPWATNGRNGVAFKAKSLNAASGSAK